MLPGCRAPSAAMLLLLSGTGTRAAVPLRSLVSVPVLHSCAPSLICPLAPLPLHLAAAGSVHMGNSAAHACRLPLPPTT